MLERRPAWTQGQREETGEEPKQIAPATAGHPAVGDVFQQPWKLSKTKKLSIFPGDSPQPQISSSTAQPGCPLLFVLAYKTEFL